MLEHVHLYSDIMDSVGSIRRVSNTLPLKEDILASGHAERADLCCRRGEWTLWLLMQRPHHSQHFYPRFQLTAL